MFSAFEEAGMFEKDAVSHFLYIILKFFPKTL